MIVALLARHGIDVSNNMGSILIRYPKNIMSRLTSGLQRYYFVDVGPISIQYSLWYLCYRGAAMVFYTQIRKMSLTHIRSRVDMSVVLILEWINTRNPLYQNTRIDDG